MTPAAAAYYVEAFHLALAPAGKGQVLVSRSHRMQHPDLVRALEDDGREAICAELQRRVVPFLPLGGSQPSCDPWRHAQEGLLRMLAARARLEQWRAEGHDPQVRWDPSVAIVDSKTGKPLASPSFILPELLYLLRDQPQAPTALHFYASDQQPSGQRLA